MNVPNIIHLMFFPWGKDQKLIADQNNFDHGPYERMKRYAPDFEVMLWDYYATEKLCLEFYPEIWRVANEQPRPMMLVNTLRWLMVYHHGGISWQYDMNPLRPMAAYLPSSDKECRVFTEFELTPEQCRIKSDQEPIREGIPEEPVRIPSQVFSAVPRHRYMKAVVDFIHERSKTYTFKRDYDCQFMTGNAAASTAYDLFGKNDPTVERVGAVDTRRMIKIIYLGSWRTEVAKTDAEARMRDAGASSMVLGASLKRVMKKLPGYYRIRPHGHEAAFMALRNPGAGMSAVGGSAFGGRDADVGMGEEENVVPLPDAACRIQPVGEVDATVVQAIAGLLREREFRSVLNFPAPHLPGLRELIEKGIRYREADLVRGGAAHWINPLIMPVPKMDLLIMRNYFDHLPDYETLEVLRRCREVGVKYILASHYPCLNQNWENYPGEWQPLKLTLNPFNLPEPEVWIPDPDPGRRTDRGLGLFRL